MVSERGAGALDAVHQPDQALHGRHDLLLVVDLLPKFTGSPVWWDCSVAFA